MSATVAPRILDEIRSQKQLLIELLEELTAAESPSRHPDIHDRIRRALATMFVDVGFAVREVGQPGAARHVYARPRERQRDRPLQLVVGHYDTVWPVGTLAERPFAVDGNIIRGPGVFDMKGGIVMCLLALRSIARLGIDLPATPVIFVNADEEIGSRSSTRFIRQLARRSARALVLEPAMGDDGLLKTERKTLPYIHLVIKYR